MVCFTWCCFVCCNISFGFGQLETRFRSHFFLQNIWLPNWTWWVHIQIFTQLQYNYSILWWIWNVIYYSKARNNNLSARDNLYNNNRVVLFTYMGTFVHKLYFTAGCLLVHRRAWSCLQKTYFGGGTVEMADCHSPSTVLRKELHER